jgi:carbon starvation protein CstA
LLTLLTIIALLVGGLILGPIMQLYSFDKLWTGFPFGYDLTDNKTAVGMILWIIAYWRIRKEPNKKWWVIAASILLIIVFLIPHSILGTEIDWTKVDSPR